MQDLWNRLSRLLCVKSIVTIALTVVFSRMALDGRITADQFMTIFSIVVAFYFSTQAVKKEENNGSDTH